MPTEYTASTLTNERPLFFLLRSRQWESKARGVHTFYDCSLTILNVVLYTRRGCHLCDDALALLKRHGLAAREVDIDADPGLRARYDCCVPVVEIDGRERFRGRVDERLLRRLLAGLPDDQSANQGT